MCVYIYIHIKDTTERERARIVSTTSSEEAAWLVLLFYPSIRWYNKDAFHRCDIRLLLSAVYIQANSYNLTSFACLFSRLLHSCLTHKDIRRLFLSWYWFYLAPRAIFFSYHRFVFFFLFLVVASSALFSSSFFFSSTSFVVFPHLLFFFVPFHPRRP